ncbi:hypothetical protein BFL35_08215 [Clavibacter michiganensis]|nr:hypothetical protein BFL35_08215 [Clavibacter michiganensis]
MLAPHGTGHAGAARGLAGADEGGEPARIRPLVVVEEHQQVVAPGLVERAVPGRRDAGRRLVHVGDRRGGVGGRVLHGRAGAACGVVVDHDDPHRAGERRVGLRGLAQLRGLRGDEGQHGADVVGPAVGEDRDHERGGGRGGAGSGGSGGRRGRRHRAPAAGEPVPVDDPAHGRRHRGHRVHELPPPALQQHLVRDHGREQPPAAERPGVEVAGPVEEPVPDVVVVVRARLRLARARVPGALRAALGVHGHGVLHDPQASARLHDLARQVHVLPVEEVVVGEAADARPQLVGHEQARARQPRLDRLARVLRAPGGGADPAVGEVEVGSAEPRAAVRPEDERGHEGERVRRHGVAQHGELVGLDGRVRVEQQELPRAEVARRGHADVHAGPEARVRVRVHAVHARRRMRGEPPHAKPLGVGRAVVDDHEQRVAQALDERQHVLAHEVGGSVVHDHDGEQGGAGHGHPIGRARAAGLGRGYGRVVA